LAYSSSPFLLRKNPLGIYYYLKRKRKDYVKIATIAITIAAIERPIAKPEPPRLDI